MPFLTIFRHLNFSPRQCRDCKQKGVETKLSPCGCRLCSKCWGAWHLDSSVCTTPCDNCGTSYPHEELLECSGCRKRHCSRPTCLKGCLCNSTCPTCSETELVYYCNKEGCSFSACESCWDYFYKDQCPECKTDLYGSPTQKCTFCDEMEDRYYDYDTPQKERGIPVCIDHQFYGTGKLLTLQTLCLMEISKIGPIPSGQGSGFIETWKLSTFPDRPKDQSLESPEDPL